MLTKTVTKISEIPTVKEPVLTPLEPQKDYYFIPNRQVSMSELYHYRLYEESLPDGIDTDDLAAVIAFLNANYDDRHKVGWLMSRSGLRVHKELEVSGFFSKLEMQHLLECCKEVQNIE
jgi:hypothetical protein